MARDAYAVAQSQTGFSGEPPPPTHTHARTQRERSTWMAWRRRSFTHVQSQTHTCTDACAARHSYASLAMGHMSGHCALSSQLFQCCRNLPHLFYSHTHMPPSPPNDADGISNQMSSRLGHLKSTWIRRQVDSRWETKLARSKST